MTTASETMRKLFLAHFQGDEPAFRTAAWEAVEHERRINRSVFAAELERILSEANAAQPQRQNALTALANGALPRDKDRNASLIELIQPRRELADLVLHQTVRESLDRIVVEWRKADILKAHSLRPICKTLFFGLPGGGKTIAAEALAKELYLPLASVRFDAVVSSYLGETAANLRKVFEFARTRPMVLLFDEFDAIGKERASTDEHGELKRVVSSFLQILDSFRADTLVVAATNHEQLLDTALWRRFDEVVFFPKPAVREIESLLAKHFRQMTVAHSVRLGEIASQLTGASHADVERVAVDAIKQAILAEQDQIDSCCLGEAVRRFHARQHASTSSASTSASSIGEERPLKRQRHKQSD